jgi:dTMP kinase
MLVTFEGPDGSGKTTQMALLAEFLTGQGYAPVQVREPGGTPIGEQIREVLHHIENREMQPRAEVLLYSAARAQLVEQVIRPALAEGRIVLCDRFYDSTFAYQGFGHGLDSGALRQLTEFATGGLTPDLTLYIDIAPEEGLKRRQRNAVGEWNRLDALGLEFHRRVYAGYQQLIAHEPGRWVKIDGDRAVEAIQADIEGVIKQRIPALHGGDSQQGRA